MKHTFYAHLVDLTEIEIRLDSHGLKKHEKDELFLMVKETLHYRVVSEILTHLPEEHHDWFLEEYTKVPHSKQLLAQLKDQVAEIEDKIKGVVDRVKEEILAELQAEE